MMLSPEETSCRYKVTSSIVIILNLWVQLWVPKEETFPIPLKYMDVARSTHTDLDVMQEKKVSVTTGMSIRTEACQIRGEDSQSSLNWKRKLQKDTCDLGRDWQRFKRLPDHNIDRQKWGPKMVKPLRIEKNKNGQKKSLHLTMLENWEEFTLLIQRTENHLNFSKT